MHTVILGNGIVALSIAFRLAKRLGSGDRITIVGRSHRHGSATLAAAAKLVPKSATQVKVRAVGYVQPSAFHGNDISLSTKRARVVAAALRDEGIEGTYSISGRGPAARRGAEARRVDITISFTPTG